MGGMRGGAGAGPGALDRDDDGRGHRDDGQHSASQEPGMDLADVQRITNAGSERPDTPLRRDGGTGRSGRQPAGAVSADRVTQKTPAVAVRTRTAAVLPVLPVLPAKIWSTWAASLAPGFALVHEVPALCPDIRIEQSPL